LIIFICQLNILIFLNLDHTHVYIIIIIYGKTEFNNISSAKKDNLKFILKKEIPK